MGDSVISDEQRLREAMGRWRGERAAEHRRYALKSFCKSRSPRVARSNASRRHQRQSKHGQRWARSPRSESLACSRYPCPCASRPTRAMCTDARVHRFTLAQRFWLPTRSRAAEPKVFSERYSHAETKIFVAEMKARPLKDVWQRAITVRAVAGNYLRNLRIQSRAALNYTKRLALARS